MILILGLDLLEHLETVIFGISCQISGFGRWCAIWARWLLVALGFLTIMQNRLELRWKGGAGGVLRSCW